MNKETINKFIVADETANKKSRFEILTTQELLAQQAPINWIVDGLISEGSTSLVFGDGKSGKTYSMLDMGVCVATGTPWLGMTTTPGNVLIIDEENGKRRLSRRVASVISGHDTDHNIPIFAVSLSRLNLGDKNDQAETTNLIRDTQAKIVIIDSLVDIMPGKNENAVDETNPIFQYLRGAAEDLQCAILVIHHNNKGGGYRGSTAIKAAVDLMLSVKKKNDNLTFQTEGARDTKEFAFSARMNFLDDKFWLTESEFEKTTADYRIGDRHVLKYLATYNTGTQKAIQENAEATDTCSRETARKAVSHLENIGLLERVDSGGRGKIGVYKLTAQGKTAAEGLL